MDIVTAVTMGLIAALTPEQLRWVDLTGEMVAFMAAFAGGVFAGRVWQGRRFVQWASENPTEVYKLAEELRKLELRQASEAN
jgi:hypothetical protein